MKAIQLTARRRNKVVILDAIIPRIKYPTRHILTAQNVCQAIMAACAVPSVLAAAAENDTLIGIFALVYTACLSVLFVQKGGTK